MIKISNLIIIFIAVVFFPRILTAMGAPALINFLHFPFVLLLTGSIVPKITTLTSKKFFIGLFILFTTITASALINNAGFLNIVLSFLLLAEPFLLLMVITSIPISQTSNEQFKTWLMIFSAIHIIIIYYQFFIIRSPDPDDVQGVFTGQGAGHHVGGAIALAVAVFFVMTYPKLALWLRILVGVIFAADISFSDSKQVLIVFVVSFVIIIFTKLKNLGEIIKYLAIAIIIIGLTYWFAQIAFSSSLSFWGKDDRILQGIGVKFSVFPIINSYYSSPLDWLFGIGPGHSIGRLAWLIPDYQELLQPLGITSNPEVAETIFLVNDTHPLTNKITGSSMFSLTFSWAGVWGDLGIIGLGVYLYLWVLVWKTCPDTLSQFFLVTILVHGAIFSWMEEPGYMLFMISLIGIQWQKAQLTLLATSPLLAKKA
ncbi:hypothetical protein [Synechocystis sp. PCC 7509]|uniref:hypothetical protein n=1 Tax=Synechocystis sp. PCC 7509 TaxID=927677 RepID=UPI0002ABDAC4|nr:hypothetical protein [Synechocystis sp. PCC 7509]